jgi:Asp-tRNA(Asn)/Glu-tRNA(Gln) amidotransferase A subunit family amidase
VQRLVDAGAICVGKTNLDQFATGLVGTRSPYGAVPNSFDPSRVSGGSSSGSAYAVARARCPFALGTDTAGSGRVPAGFNNIVGLKPTPGRVGTGGVLPACRSIDCVSVLALTVDDAARCSPSSKGRTRATATASSRPARRS